MIWRFQIYNLFCEILKSRRSKTEFRDEIYIFCETNCISRSRASKRYVIKRVAANHLCLLYCKSVYMHRNF